MFHALMDSLFGHSIWNVGVCRTPIREVLETGLLRDIEWLPDHDPDRYIADPFVYIHDGEIRLLVEEYDFFQTARGCISALSLSQSDHGLRISEAIRRPHHLSYPFIFEHARQTWLVPEEAEAGRLVLYRLRPDGSWAEEKILLDGVAAVDPTVFYHEGLWWLFFTDADRDPFRTLYACYAESPTGVWAPHRANPIKDDLAGARPGGTPFHLDGVTYRPAQNGASTYGGSLKIQAIRTLTPDTFVEETVVELKPAPDSLFPDGLHHLCVYNDLIIVDGKRKIMDWRWIYRQRVHDRMKRQRREPLKR